MKIRGKIGILVILTLFLTLLIILPSLLAQEKIEIKFLKTHEKLNQSFNLEEQKYIIDDFYNFLDNNFSLNQRKILIPALFDTFSRIKKLKELKIDQNLFTKQCLLSLKIILKTDLQGIDQLAKEIFSKIIKSVACRIWLQALSDQELMKIIKNTSQTFSLDKFLNWAEKNIFIIKAEDPEELQTPFSVYLIKSQEIKFSPKGLTQDFDTLVTALIHELANKYFFEHLTQKEKQKIYEILNCCNWESLIEVCPQYSYLFSYYHGSKLVLPEYIEPNPDFEKETLKGKQNYLAKGILKFKKDFYLADQGGKLLLYLENQENLKEYLDQEITIIEGKLNLKTLKFKINLLL